MVNHQQIGLIAWGLKLGKDVFFSLGGVSAKEIEIVRTMEDARGIINMPHSGETFYSVEFTDRYKVYTIFYTVVDWGNRDNAYLAISLFVPYHIVFKDKVLTVLQALLGIYQQYYIDPGQRIARQQERADLFETKLKEFPIEDMGWAMKRPNAAQDTNYAHIRYENDRQLAEFLDNPCLDSFNGHKEIYFLQAGNNKLSAVNALGPPLQVQPKQLFRTVQLVLQDDEGQSLPPPFQCSINGEAFFDENSIEYKIKDQNLQELTVKAQKEGYLTFNKPLNLATDFRERHYAVRLAKRQPLKLHFVSISDDHASLKGVKVEVQKNDRSTTQRGESDDKGEVVFDNFYSDEPFYLTVSKEGFDGKTKIITMPKGGISTIYLDKTTVAPSVKSPTEINIRAGAVITPSPNLVDNSIVTSITTEVDGLSKSTKKPSNLKEGKNKKTKKAKKAKKMASANEAQPAPSKTISTVVVFAIGLLIAAALVLGVYFIVVRVQKTKILKETKENLLSTLSSTYKPAKDTYSEVRELSNALNTMTTSRFRDSVLELTPRISSAEESLQRDSIRLAQEINDLKQDSLKSSIEKSISEAFTSHRTEAEGFKAKAEQLKSDIQQEQEGIQAGKNAEAEKAKRRKELTEFATTMCIGREGKPDSKKANNYKKEVEKNAIGFSEQEKNDLIIKYALIVDMLTYDWNGRNAKTFEDQNKAKEALKAIKQKRGRELSPTQFKWLEGTIAAKWTIKQ